MAPVVATGHRDRRPRRPPATSKERLVDSTEHTVQGYSAKLAADVVGITYRQLDYWARTDLVVPSVARAAGSGSRRLYSYANLLELKVIKRLLDS
ncbi:MAG: MerR family transcriptional regulator, partial [Acidimicrobiaceae bacterium]|nr:MerR family transcriptional regulator [Acidimicrobiaceae bacterium]